jgi:hypothetical protein
MLNLAFMKCDEMMLIVLSEILLESKIN